MRVALSVDAIEPALTGIGRYSLELVRGLARQPDVSELRFFRGADPVANPELLLLPSVTARRSRLERWWDRRTSMAQLKAMRSSIVHAPNFFLPDWAEGGVATIHDLSVFHFPETHPRERIEDFERRFDRTIARASRIITGSQAIRRELVDTLGIPATMIDVVGHGVHRPIRPAERHLSEKLRSAGVLGGQYSLCVATIEPRKRIAELIDAYALLPSPIRSRFPLVIVGKNGWLADGIIERIERATADGWLRWLGFAADDMLEALYFGARLFIYPSRYEGFGLPPIEAMAHQVPVLISNDASLVEVSGAAAKVVDADDPAQFAHAIQRGLEDDAWRETAIARGEQLVASMGWDETVRQTIATYRAALQVRA